MKQIFYSVATAILAVTMFGCAEDAAVEDPLRLSFKVNSADNQTVSDLPAETSLYVSMETPGGDPVMTMQSVPFTKDGAEYTATGLDLAPGSYVLTEFMLVDGQGDVLYTIPYKDSPLKNAVSTPLGIDLSVTPGSPRSVIAEALEVRKHKPADFGLASFKIRNSFQVMVSEDGSGKPIRAKAFVLSDGDTVGVYDLPAKKTRISVDGDLNGKYSLVVMKEACAASVTEFRLSDFATKYSSKPLKLSLAPAFTMTARATAGTDYPFYFYIGGSDTELSINWGDGNVESVIINDPLGTEINHAYTASGTYPITITGDLDKIVHFYSFYGGSEFTDIQFQHLTNLRELLYGLTACPATLDLSNNTKLEEAMLPGLRDLNKLILPATHSLSFLEIDGENNLSAANVNEIINNVYTNTSKASIHGGILSLRGSWVQEEGDMTMVGPPSPDSMVLLESLKNDFGWIVKPLDDTKLKTDGRIAARRRI